MVMAWRFGAVSPAAVLAVIAVDELFTTWMIGVPEAVRMDTRWPNTGSVVSQRTEREARARHSTSRHLTVAIVESWEAARGISLQLHSGLGGWVRVVIAVQPRPGGSLIEVSAEPLTASARLRYAGPARSRAEKRCTDVADSLISLAEARTDTTTEWSPR
jgi:hypothetical protein